MAFKEHNSNQCGKGLACDFLANGKLLKCTGRFLAESERTARQQISKNCIVTQPWPLGRSNFYVGMGIYNVL